MRRSPILAVTVLAAACGQVAPTGRRPVEELPPGQRVLHLSADDGGADEGLVHGSTTSSARLLSDTWAIQAGTGYYDYGTSCELKVSHSLVPNPKKALLKFALPPSLPCGSITSATLSLTTAQLPASGYLTVLARKVTNPWMAGLTGAADCKDCSVSSDRAAPFALPNSAPAHSVPVGQPCQTHSWPVTSMVVDWCTAPSTNFGVLLEGVAPFTTSEVNFHSMEAPSGQPVLTIVYGP
jgi:hypothetical protein